MKRKIFFALVAVLWLAAPSYAATVYVHAGDNLQTAINNAQPGDTLILDAGATFNGPITLPNKGGTNYITIQSSALALLPGPGRRVSPSDATNMPKIVAPNADNALRTAAAASYYQIVGVEFAPANSSATIYDLILLGDGGTSQNSLSLVPHHLRLDRCYIHGYSSQYVKRGIGLHSKETSILNSHISDIHVEGQDSQGVAGWNGPGPFHIVNNYIAAAGQNIGFGGSLPAIQDLVPSDIDILRNHLYKPLSWKPGEAGYGGIPWTVKSLLELKSGKRVVIEGNLMENQWDNFNGYAAVNFTVRNDSGSWATLQNITLRNNIVRHAAMGLNILGLDTSGPTVQSHDMTISNNVFEDVNGPRWDDDGMWIKLSSMNNLTLDHNTVFQTYDVILVYGPACTGFVMTNNISPHNTYGIIGAGHGSGADTISTYFPSSTIRRNIIPGASAGYPNFYPADNYYPTSLSAVGFVNQAGGDYNLSSSSSYKGLATDGKDIGVDQNALETATAVLLTQPVSNAFNVKINFQTATASVPSGYLADAGAVYADRGNGYSYGWDVANVAPVERNSPNSSDKRYDTLCHMQLYGNYTWEIAVPNGTYTVRVVAGDPEYNDGVYKINVEGVLTVNGTPSGSNHWIEGTQTVNVTDGKLTVSSATGSSNNKIDFVEITSN